MSSQRAQTSGCSLRSFAKYFLSSWLFPCAVIGVLIADQWSKLAVRANLELGERVSVIDGFLNLVFTLNQGIAFGLLSGNRHPYKLVVLSLGALSAVVIFSWFAAHYGGEKRYIGLAAALLIGGTFGNLIDRLSFGAVIDFIDLHWKHKFHWPAFNVADAAVSIATLLILVRIVKTGFGAQGQRDQGSRPSDQPFQPPAQQESRC